VAAVALAYWVKAQAARLALQRSLIILAAVAAAVQAALMVTRPARLQAVLATTTELGRAVVGITPKTQMKAEGITPTQPVAAAAEALSASSGQVTLANSHQQTQETCNDDVYST
jgi:hypothetical protein